MGPKIRLFLKYVLPWAVAAAIFYFLFRQYPPSQVLQAAEGVHVWLFVSFSVGYFFCMWFFDCWSLAAIFTKFGVSSSVRELLRIRSASYLVMIVNYGAAQGLLAYFFKKHKKISLSKSAGLFTLVMCLDLYWTATFAFAASWFGRVVVRGIDLAPTLRILWIVATAGVALILFALKFPVSWRRVTSIRSHEFLNAFPRAPLWKYGLGFLERLPLHLALNTTLFFVALAFGVVIPIQEVLARFPVVSVAATLPITPGGLGTAQVAVVELFKEAASPERLLAMSLLFTLTNAVLKVTFGAVFFKKAASRNP